MKKLAIIALALLSACDLTPPNVRHARERQQFQREMRELHAENERNFQREMQTPEGRAEYQRLLRAGTDSPSICWSPIFGTQACMGDYAPPGKAPPFPM